jgi:hypothetical protein
VKGVASKSSFETSQYTAAVVWKTSGGVALGTGANFAASTQYKAEVTITPKTGYTFTGFTGTNPDVFTASGASSTGFTQAADSANWKVTTGLFPATAP